MSIKIYVKYVKNNRDFHTTKLNLPTGNLDSKSSHDIMQLIHELHQQGNTIVLITHDNDIANEAPRRVKLLDGKVIHDSKEETIGAEVKAKEEAE